MAPPNPQVSSACSNWVGSFNPHMCRMRETTTDYMIVAYTIRYYMRVLFHIGEYLSSRAQL